MTRGRAAGTGGFTPLARYGNTPLMHVLLIVGLAVLVYANTFSAPFVFDDEPSIVENEVIRDLDHFVGDASGYRYNPRRFVGYLTFALNYRIGGLDVTGYHLVNLAVHSINGLLVYLLVLTIFRTPVVQNASSAPSARTIALFTALLFVAHPLQTGAVTYIVQRVTSLAALFSLIAVLLYGYARLEGEPGRPLRGRTLALYMASLVSAVLAMKTKEVAFTLPLLVVLFESFFFRGAWKRRTLALVPYVLTLLIIPLSLLNLSEPLGITLSDLSEVTRVQTEISRWEYLLTQFPVLITYLRLLVLPIGQNLDYDYPVYRSFFTAPVVLSFTILVTILAVALFLLYRSNRNSGGRRPEFRVVAYGIFWFFIGLSVESSVIPIADVIFEHRVYLPSAGFFLAAVTSVVLLKNRLHARSSRAEQLVIPLLAVAVVLLGTATVARNTVWRDAVRLWQDVVRKSPAKARPHYNLGLMYEKQGRFSEALAEYLTALRIDPYYTLAHNNLGNLYGMQGRFEEAKREFQAVFRLEPGDATAHVNMGVLYSRMGFVQDAQREFEIAVQLQPEHAAAHFSLGKAYSDGGRMEEAVQAYERAIRLKPDYTDAHVNLGILYGRAGLLDQAIAHFETALQLSPGDPAIAHNLSHAYRLRKQAGDATPHRRSQKHGPR